MGYRKITLINSTFEKPGQIDALNGGQKQALDDISTLKLPAKTIDQWPTLVSLTTVHQAIPINFVIDAVAIQEQTTWVIPVIGKESRARAMSKRRCRPARIRIIGRVQSTMNA